MSVQKFGVVTPRNVGPLEQRVDSPQVALTGLTLSDLPGGLGNGLLDRVRGTARQVDIHLT
jgi:hypothetical protein